MSAVNVIVQSKAVHVITDGAAYFEDGAIVATGVKAWPLPHVSAIVCARGPMLAPAVFAQTLAAHGQTYDQVRDLAEILFRSACDTMSGLFDACRLGADVELIVAGWSETRGPDAYLIASHNRYGEPYKVHQLAGLCPLPATEEIVAKLATMFPAGTTADDFDIERDGLRILELQRDTKIEIGSGERASVVGGFAQRTTIKEPGVIETAIFHRWQKKSKAA